MKYTFIIIAFIISLQAKAQFHQSVLQGESGNTLLTHLANNYKPTTVLNYGAARDFLYGTVYNHNDSLTGVYSEYTIYLNPNADPTDDAFAKGINCEHTYPRSKGANTGNPKSDMHHLFPSKIEVNSARESFPFAEINDNDTEHWFYWDIDQTSIPSTDIDLYSEMKNGYFEPREDHKGNVARAMFYFYTMYKTQADAAAPGYFEGQKETLCQWFYQDPVNETEWNATWQIATKQNNKPNPFVLDCTLPQRCYCADFGYECIPVSVDEQTDIQAITLFPNPAKNIVTLNISLNSSHNSSDLIVFNQLGQEVKHFKIKSLRQGENEFSIDITTLENGFYFFTLSLNNQITTGKIIVNH